MNNINDKEILNFTKQINRGFDLENISLDFGQKITNFLFCGMGGSALAAQFIKEFYPIRIHRNYDLPKDLKIKNTLVVCVSYSGNTEETLSAYDASFKKKLPLLAISSGGKLKEKANKDNVPFIEIKTKNIQPRMSIFEQISIILSLIKKIGLKPIEDYSFIASSIKPPAWQKPGEKIANNLVNKVPLIYVSNKNKAFGYYWKIAFNENSKVPSFCNCFPELNHNELMQGKGIDWTSKFCILILFDQEENPRIRKRMKLTAKIMKDKGFNVTSIELKGKTPLEKIFNNIILASWTSFHLASLAGIEPTDPDVLEDFKKMMA